MNKKTTVKNHYIPVHYLEGFCSSDKTLFRFEKGSDNVVESSPTGVGFEKNLYPIELEDALNLDIEVPANAVLDKLRQERMIDDDEKRVLSVYIVNMLHRVPNGYARLKQMAPKVIDNVGANIDEQFRHLLNTYPQYRHLLEKRWQESLQQREQWKVNPPREVWHFVLDAGRNFKTVEALSKMVWEFYVADKPLFLTCDNPVFFTRDIGIGSAHAEVNFPISSYILLSATHILSDSRKFFTATAERISQANVRTIQGASQYVFHCENAPWVSGLLGN